MPDEEFLLILLDDWLAEFCEALPVHPPQRVTWPVFAQRDKFLRFPDRRRQRNAAQLVFHRSWQPRAGIG